MFLVVSGLENYVAPPTGGKRPLNIILTVPDCFCLAEERLEWHFLEQQSGKCVKVWQGEDREKRRKGE